MVGISSRTNEFGRTVQALKFLVNDNGEGIVKLVKKILRDEQGRVVAKI